MDVSAEEVLRTYANPSLQQMVRQRGHELKRTKEELIAALTPLLYDQEAIARALADLSTGERTLLDRLILAGGDASTNLIRQQLERDRVVEKPVPTKRAGYASYYNREKGSFRARDSNKFEDVVARLGVLGLVFTAEPLNSSGTLVELAEPGRRLYIPEEILRHLPPVELAVETVPDPPTIRVADAAPLLRDIYLLLSFAAREPIPLTTRGLIHKRTLVRIDETLRRPEGTASVRSEDELGRVPFLRGLCQELGLLVATVGELILTAQVEELLRLPASERQTRLFLAYAQTDLWCELYRIPNLEIYGRGASLREAPEAVILARQRVLTELLEMPTGEWIALDHLIERLRLRAYEFLFPRRRSPHSYYYYGSYGYNSQPNPYTDGNELGLSFEGLDEQEGWDKVEGGFIRAIVTEALPTFGMIDLGEQNGSVTAFRLTEDGARLLHGEPLPTVPSAAQVVIQPNFQIFAFEPTGEDALFTLDQMAQRVRADQAIEYELTRDSVYRAQRAGFDAAAIIAFLESVSTVGVPQNVRRTLEEWGSQLERITLRRRAPLLHTIDEATLDALYADPDLAPLLGRRVAPTVALVPSADLRPLTDRLIERGTLPALTEGSPERPSPTLAVNAEGRLTFHQRLPSVYDLGQVRPFADEEDGALRLSPASLRRGAKAKLAADEIVATLERLHAGPLPPEVPALVRRWAKDWGRGALLETALLQVEQPGTLTDLLADPEVKPHLQAVPGAPTLALVRPEAVERLRALLDARGMALGDRLIR